MRRGIKILDRLARLRSIKSILTAPQRGRSTRLNRTHNPATGQVQFEPMEPRVFLSVSGGGGWLQHFDHDLHVDPLPAVDMALADANSNADSANGVDATTGAAPYSLSDTFSLHSNLGAAHTIYLDFDGHLTQNTSWNSSKGISQIVTPAYDFDGDVSSFSDSELQRIQNIFDRVAEDFIPFDVDVTTEEPSLSDLIKSGSTDTNWGVRVVIGGSSSDWYGSSAGGVAYYNSFNWNSDTPAFAFEANLGNGNEKYTAEAISHEAGHALNLRHDGASGTSYYQGHGSGETGWAPIMGSGYYKNLTQWSSGEYTGANNGEDDLSIITGSNGFGYRADDHSGTFSGATALSLSGNSLGNSGIIERNTDYDVFSFTTAAGDISLDISPFERGPNLDIYAELLDSGNNLITVSNPADLLGASINASLDSGTYYLRISGTGTGDPTGTGYSDYASLGRYTIAGDVVSPGPVLSVSDASVNEADGQATFTVQLSEANPSSVSVDFATSNGTATNGIDFHGVSQTLSFAPGQTSMTVSVPIINDQSTESTEDFSVVLNNPSSGVTIGDGHGTGTIVDDDVVVPDNNVTVSIGNASVTEGNPFKGKKAGTPKKTNMTFTISLSAVASELVTVHYATADQTATAGEDYDARNGTITFSPGETSKTVTVAVLGDSVAEQNETLSVELLSATGADISDGQGVGTIVNDDSSGGGGSGGGKGKKGGRNRSDVPSQGRDEKLMGPRQNLISQHGALFYDFFINHSSSESHPWSPFGDQPSDDAA